MLRPFALQVGKNPVSWINRTGRAYPCVPTCSSRSRCSMDARSKSDRRRRFVMSAAKAFRHSARKVLAAALSASAIACPAADAPAPAASADAPAFSAELVKPGLYRIGGGGGTTLLRVSPDGLIVVDSKRAGMVGLLMAEIQRV